MKKRNALISILLITALLLPGCGKKVISPELMKPIENPDALFTAKKMVLDTVYMKDGSVCPEVQDIKFDFDSKVYDVQVNIGDFVEEGDLLFCLDESTEMAIKEAEINLTIRQKDYEIALKDHKDQIANLTNLKNMFAGMNDWYNYNLWDINIRENEANFTLQYEKTAIELEELQEELDELKEKWESSMITAPVSGQIVYLSVHNDDDSFEKNTTVCSIARQDKKLLCCDLIEEKEYDAYSDVSVMIKGKSYPIKYIPYDEEELYRMKLRSQNLYSYFEVEGLPDDVTFGEYVVFYLTVTSETPVLAVPSQALVKDGSKTYVKVVSGERQGLRSVTVGFSNKNYTEITSGISEGDTVFVANNLGRYGVEYESTKPQNADFLSNGYNSVRRLSFTPESFENPVKGEINEIYVPTFSQFYVTAGQKLYTITPDIDDSVYEEAKLDLQKAQDAYKKKLRDDKEALDNQKKNLNNMAKSLKKELAQLQYDRALREYEKYQIEGQELIDKYQKRVDDFEIWKQGDFTVYAEQDGFFTTFSKLSVGAEVDYDQKICDFYEVSSLYLGGTDNDRNLRYGMTVTYECLLNGETVTKTGKVISAYDVRPEEVDDANGIVVLLDDGVYDDIDSDGHVDYVYCNASQILSVPVNLVLRDRKKTGDESSDESDDSLSGDRLSDEEKNKGVPYVWVYDENGQIVKRYITIVQYNKEIAWICDGITSNDVLVIH